MVTRALALRNEIVSRLVADTPGGVPASSIFIDLRQAIAEAVRPAIVVDIGEESAPERDYGVKVRSVSITVRILADGADSFTVIDPIRIDAHAAITADGTLGGLCETIIEGGSSRDRVDLDTQIGSLVTAYSVRYRTAGESLI